MHGRLSPPYSMLYEENGLYNCTVPVAEWKRRDQYSFFFLSLSLLLAHHFRKEGGKGRGEGVISIRHTPCLSELTLAALAERERERGKK